MGVGVGYRLATFSLLPFTFAMPLPGGTLPIRNGLPERGGALRLLPDY